VDKHDYNLNIRRYVDNTPDPEPEDVQAHLIGGVPVAEVQARQSDFAKFGVAPNTLFQPERLGYLAFVTDIATKPGIRTNLESDAALKKTLTVHHNALEVWWGVARDDFA
jgi:type I restriction enzyme M protein